MNWDWTIGKFDIFLCFLWAYGDNVNLRESQVRNVFEWFNGIQTTNIHCLLISLLTYIFTKLKKSPIKAMKLNKASQIWRETQKIISSFYFWAWILFIALNLRFFISNSTCSIQIVYIHQTQAHTQTHVQYSKIYIILFSTDCVFLCTLYSTFFYIFKIFTKKYIYK